MSDELADRRVLDALTSIVSAAAAAIMAVIRAGSLETRSKADRSPVTAADHAAQEVILAGLASLLPGVPVVSEEATPPEHLGEAFILVDPLDGTRELVEGRDEFTVNVAVILGGAPRLGIVSAPGQGRIWRGTVGMGAERLDLAPGAPVGDARDMRPIRTRPCPLDGIVAALSRSHLDPRTRALLERLPVGERLACGSSVKFCQLAEGTADIYPRLATTCEWDIAAGHAVLVAAGGTVTTPEATPLIYGGHVDFRVPAFIAWGDLRAAARFAGA